MSAARSLRLCRYEGWLVDGYEVTGVCIQYDRLFSANEESIRLE